MPKINWDGRSAGNGTWVYEGNELKPKYGAQSRTIPLNLTAAC